MYEKDYYIGSNDVDQFLELKLPSFFRMMQDVSTEHAEKLGIGKATTIDKGMYWVITRIELDIIRMPKYLETVKLVTYPGDNMRFMFPRYFTLFNQKGDVLIHASSMWMVLDKINHRICLKPFEGTDFPEEHTEGELPLPKKANVSDVEEVEQRKVRYSDIDLNGHLNNTKYIDYIVDIHDSAFYKENRISHFLINYDKELRDNDTLTLLKNNENPECIIGKVGDQTALTVNIQYQKRN